MLFLTKDSKNQVGFSLIEISLVLIVIGLIVATIVPLLVSQIKQEKVSAGRDLVRQARDEIIGYAMQHNGELPANLEDVAGHSIGAWREELFYHNASISDYCSVGASQGFNMTIPNSPNVENIAFLVGSKGANHQLDIDLNNNPIEIKAYEEISSYSGNKYDDIVEFVSIDYLKNAACWKPDCVISGSGDIFWDNTDCVDVKGIVLVKNNTSIKFHGINNIKADKVIFERGSSVNLNENNWD